MPDLKAIAMPASFLNESAEAIAALGDDEDATDEDATDEDATDEELTLAAMQFVVYHEMGHPLVEQLALPITGKEEDAVDGLAAFLTVRDDEAGAFPALSAAMLFASFTDDTPPTLEDYADEHSLDEHAGALRTGRLGVREGGPEARRGGGEGRDRGPELVREGRVDAVGERPPFFRPDTNVCLYPGGWIMNSRQQGDIGEISAAHWLAGIGAYVATPQCHSPDWDLIAELDEELFRVQVKTSTYRQKDRWSVMVCTRGGNQSWNGLVKRFSPARCDYLFVLVGDGRRWFIPAHAVEGSTHVSLGGPKYAEFEIEPDRPIAEWEQPRRRSRIAEARGDVRVAKGDAL